MRTECELCGSPLEGFGHAICPACRGMAPAGVLAAPAGCRDGTGTGAAVHGVTAAAVARPLSGDSLVRPPEALRLCEDPRLHADSGPKSDRANLFWPRQFMSSLSAVFVVMCLLTVLTIFVPVGLESRADPNLTPAHVKPEWYFLFLYEFLHFMPAILGIFAPLLGIFALVALPFLDRNPERAPRKRLVAMTGCFILCAAAAVLTIVGYME